MICDLCKVPTYSTWSGLCPYCRRQNLLARLLWRIAPRFMRARRWYQNLHDGGWL